MCSDLNFSVPWKRNPVPQSFCIITTAIADCCVPQGSFGGTEVLVLSEHNCKYLASRYGFYCLLFFLFSHSAAIIDGSTTLLLIPKAPLPDCCNTLHEEYFYLSCLNTEHTAGGPIRPTASFHTACGHTVSLLCVCVCVCVYCCWIMLKLVVMWAAKGILKSLFLQSRKRFPVLCLR